MSDSIQWNWSIGEDYFLLRLGEIEALDDSTEAGALDLRARLVEGYERGGFERARVKMREINNCIRLGLIGAGMDQAKAADRAKRAMEYVDIANRNMLCFTVLSKAFAGKPHDPVGEAGAVENPPG